MDAKRDALIIVDVQNDFLPGGPLAAKDGDKVIPVIQSLMEKVPYVVATQDWHPADHRSFAVEHKKTPGDVIDLKGVQQILWPVHCVQGSKGAEFASGISEERMDRVVRKGLDREVDSYSGFFDNQRLHQTELHKILQSQGVKRVIVTGLCTEYCVKFTAMDALDLGYEVVVIPEACRPAEIQEGDEVRALREMEEAGISLCSFEDFNP